MIFRIGYLVKNLWIQYNKEFLSSEQQGKVGQIKRKSNVICLFDLGVIK